MVFNCRTIPQEMPDSIFNAYKPLNSDKNNRPDEEVNEMVSFFLIVHGCSDLNAVELFVKGIKGVESVKCDGNSKLEVMGKVKPSKIQEMVERETKKEVELIVPSTEIKGDRDENNGTKAKFIGRVIPIPKNDVENEKTGESIIDLKIKLCCDGCKKNLQMFLKTKGLEMLNIDADKDLVTVRGIVDPTKIGSYIKDKFKKDCEVVNVAKVMASTKKDNAIVDKDRDAGAVDKKYKRKSGAKQREEGGSTVQSTVVLKISLHCDGCIEKIRKAILNCRGVKKVSANAVEDLVTVKGTMDVQELITCLKEKMKNSEEVLLVSKKDEKVDREKKDKYST